MASKLEKTLPWPNQVSKRKNLSFWKGNVENSARRNLCSGLVRPPSHTVLIIDKIEK